MIKHLFNNRFNYVTLDDINVKGLAKKILNYILWIQVYVLIYVDGMMLSN